MLIVDLPCSLAVRNTTVTSVYGPLVPSGTFLPRDFHWAPTYPVLWIPPSILNTINIGRSYTMKTKGSKHTYAWSCRRLEPLCHWSDYNVGFVRPPWRFARVEPLYGSLSSRPYSRSVYTAYDCWFCYTGVDKWWLYTRMDRLFIARPMLLSTDIICLC